MGDESLAWRLKVLRASLAMMGLLLAGETAMAQPRAPLAALSQIEPGMWQLRAEGQPTRNICLADPDSFVQMRHSGTACSRLVIANEKNNATVHYSCPGAGWGRTTLRVTTPRAVIVDTQGIADNAPFAFVTEARRTGDCPSTKSAGLDR